MKFERLRRPMISVGMLCAAVAAVGLATPSAAFELAPTPKAASGHHGDKVKHPPRKGVAGKYSTTAKGSGLLSYHGGVNGVGVTTGPPKVVLVFWGSQWGAKSIDAVTGNSTFANDPMGVAPILQQFFKGLGTNNETWSGVMTELCEGVAYGATVCPSGVPHVGYPTGGALAGVIYDGATAAPATATDAEIAAVAVKAATTAGNTTPASNRSTQYVVLSSTGLHPGGFNAPLQWCAWHDWTAGGSVGDIAYTNLPYLTDAGYSCGANYVNGGTAGLVDGVTMVEGHEYAETITDQLPGGGWWDAAGYENSDKCAWVGAGGVGGSQNITLSTGTFAVQGNFSNVTNGCAIGAVPFNSTATTVTFSATSGNQVGTVGTPASTSVSASSSDLSKAITYSATGLPAGLAIDAASGQISGTPSAAVWGSPVVVKATDSTGSSSTTSFTWTVNNVAGNTVVVSPISARTSAKGKSLSLASSATDNQSLQKLSWSATGLPTGLSINATTGTISGTPSAGGTFNVSVRATDLSSATGSTSFTWYVASVSVTNPGAKASTRSVPLTLQIVASDTAPSATIKYAASSLPSGLSINANTGLISGTPSTKQTKTVKVTATDSLGTTASASFTWAIA